MSSSSSLKLEINRVIVLDVADSIPCLMIMFKDTLDIFLINPNENTYTQFRKMSGYGKTNNSVRYQNISCIIMNGADNDKLIHIVERTARHIILDHGRKLPIQIIAPNQLQQRFHAHDQLTYSTLSSPSDSVNYGNNISISMKDNNTIIIKECDSKITYLDAESIPKICSGPQLGELKRGNDVVLSDGSTIKSSDCLKTRTRYGRCFCYLANGSVSVTRSMQEKNYNIAFHQGDYIFHKSGDKYFIGMINSGELLETYASNYSQICVNECKSTAAKRDQKIGYSPMLYLPFLPLLPHEISISLPDAGPYFSYFLSFAGEKRWLMEHIRESMIKHHKNIGGQYPHFDVAFVDEDSLHRGEVLWSDIVPATECSLIFVAFIDKSFIRKPSPLREIYTRYCYRTQNHIPLNMRLILLDDITKQSLLNQSESRVVQEVSDNKFASLYDLFHPILELTTTSCQEYASNYESLYDEKFCDMLLTHLAPAIREMANLCCNSTTISTLSSNTSSISNPKFQTIPIALAEQPRYRPFYVHIEKPSAQSPLGQEWYTLISEFLSCRIQLELKKNNQKTHIYLVDECNDKFINVRLCWEESDQSDIERIVKWKKDYDEKAQEKYEKDVKVLNDEINRIQSLPYNHPDAIRYYGWPIDHHKVRKPALAKVVGFFLKDVPPHHLLKQFKGISNCVEDDCFQLSMIRAFVFRQLFQEL